MTEDNTLRMACYGVIQTLGTTLLIIWLFFGCDSLFSTWCFIASLSGMFLPFVCLIRDRMATTPFTTFLTTILFAWSTGMFAAGAILLYDPTTNHCSEPLYGYVWILYFCLWCLLGAKIGILCGNALIDFWECE